MVFVIWAEVIYFKKIPQSLLEQCGALCRLRFGIVPRRMSEGSFWKRFFVLFREVVGQELFGRITEVGFSIFVRNHR